MIFFADEMPGKINNKDKSRWENLRNKFRMVIINDETFEEEFSMRMSLLDIIVWVSVFVIALVIFLISIIAFTPLREYIPGYSDVQTRKNAAYAVFKTDSLQHQIDLRDAYIHRVRMILAGEITADSLPNDSLDQAYYQSIRDEKSREDSIMRKQIEEQEKYALQAGDEKRNENVYFFFTPVKGVISSSFNLQKEHFGVDVVTKADETIKAVMDGTVIFAGFTTESGYVIQIQHSNNLISVYKHCSVLLKQEGMVVKAGDPIAIVGNSGEQTTGPHLHFELWEKGIPIDPQQYITF